MPSHVIVQTDMAQGTGQPTPGYLALTEDYAVNILTFAAGEVKQLATRNAMRSGMTLLPSPSMLNGLAVFPQYITPAIKSLIGLQTGPILLTLDLYRVALMGDWWGYSPDGGSVIVYDFFRIV